MIRQDVGRHIEGKSSHVQPALPHIYFVDLNIVLTSQSVPLLEVSPR